MALPPREIPCSIIVVLQKQDLPFTVDRNPHKQGHFLPGTHIPICAPQKLFKNDQTIYLFYFGI